MSKEVLLKNGFLYRLIEDESIEEASSLNLTLKPEEPIILPMDFDKLNDSFVLNESMDLYSGVVDIAKEALEENNRKKDSVDFLKRKLSLLSFVNSFSAYKVQLDLKAQTIKIDQSELRWNMLQIFDDNKTNNDSVLFFYISDVMYAYSPLKNDIIPSEDLFDSEFLEKVDDLFEYGDSALEYNDNKFKSICPITYMKYTIEDL